MQAAEARTNPGPLKLQGRQAGSAAPPCRALPHDLHRSSTLRECDRHTYHAEGDAPSATAACDGAHACGPAARPQHGQRFHPGQGALGPRHHACSTATACMSGVPVLAVPPGAGTVSDMAQSLGPRPQHSTWSQSGQGALGLRRCACSRRTRACSGMSTRAVDSHGRAQPPGPWAQHSRCSQGSAL